MYTADDSNFSLLRAHVCKRAMNMDLGATNEQEQVGQFVNVASVNFEDQVV